MRRLLIPVLAGLALAACSRDEAAEPGPPNAPAVFVHEQTSDLSGYYLPIQPVMVGKWRLDHVFVGLDTDFAAWEAGRREGDFGPVMLELVDPSSPTTATELGEVHTGRIRVLPTSYRIADDAVIIVGQAQGVGEVSFAGRLDPDALAAARRSLGVETPVLSGVLTVGGEAQGGVRLRWWAGD